VFAALLDQGWAVEGRIMNQVRLLSCAGACLLGWSAPALASSVYEDGTFATGTWGLEITTGNGGGTVSASQSAATGNPGAAFRVISSVNSGSGAAPATVNGLHRFGTNVATRYDPATQGPIGSLNFRIDHRLISGFGDGQAVQFAIKQGQVTYIGPYHTTGSSGQWGQSIDTGLTAADFSRLDGAPGNPDLSASGVPIRFGFVTSNSSVGNPYSITVDYDNFRVEVFPPCPADFNQDGGIDGADVDAFFSAWENADAAADVNADGGIDGTDVQTFFAVWEAGGCG
jgi:hypothetical protein